MIGRDSLLGQLNSLRGAKRLPSTLIFIGPNGIGKSYFIAHLTRLLLCEKDAAIPCEKCQGCTLSNSQNHPDSFSYSSANGELRDLLSRSRYAPFRSHNKVITISDSHRLSSSAHNILLKSLEEPLPNTFYLLSASATGKLPLTIISRGVVFNVPPFTDDDLRLVLAKRFGDLFTKIASKLQDDVIKISKGTMTLFAHLLAANGGNHGDSATLWKELLTAYEAVSKYDLKKFSGIAERFSKDETLIEVLITFFINTALSDTFKESRDRGNFLWHLLNFENELQNKGLNRTYRLMNALLWNSPPEKVSPQKV